MPLEQEDALVHGLGSIRCLLDFERHFARYFVEEVLGNSARCDDSVDSFEVVVVS